MEKVPAIRRHGSNWKNNVEADLQLLLDKKGALGAIVTSRNGDVITQLFLKNIPRQKENALMQLMKKAVQAINGMRSSPLRRVVFEAEEGAVVLYNAENAIVGCFMERDYDLLSIMLEIKTVGELIGSHLNAGELSREEFERIVSRDPEELKALAHDLVGNITSHYGDVIADNFIRSTLEKNQPRWAAR
jgi:predicted regulator of Ras-like GTPase activity (Roadblock/LC7/MglB family)